MPQNCLEVSHQKRKLYPAAETENLVVGRRKISTRSRCVIWTGSLSHGYGIIHYKGKNKRAHRVIWEGAVGKIPKDLCIDHICRTKACVNVNHMRVVTIKENVMCGTALPALNAKKKVCMRGHAFGPKKNTTWRECPTCKKAHNKINNKRWRAIMLRRKNEEG